MIRHINRGFTDRYRKNKTWRFSTPLATHHRRATCDEVDCEGYLNGWVTRLPVGHEYVDFVRGLKGRYEFTEYPPDEKGMIAFHFVAGQKPCFEASKHRTLVERPPILLYNGRQAEPQEWKDLWDENAERFNKEFR